MGGWAEGAQSAGEPRCVCGHLTITHPHPHLLLPHSSTIPLFCVPLLHQGYPWMDPSQAQGMQPGPYQQPWAVPDQGATASTSGRPYNDMIRYDYYGNPQDVPQQYEEAMYAQQPANSWGGQSVGAGYSQQGGVAAEGYGYPAPTAYEQGNYQGADGYGQYNGSTTAPTQDVNASGYGGYGQYAPVQYASSTGQEASGYPAAAPAGAAVQQPGTSGQAVAPAQQAAAAPTKRSSTQAFERVDDWE